jgi:hypothetical protein
MRVWCASTVGGENAMRGSFLCAGMVSVLLAASSNAALIDFNNYPNGKVINNQYFASDGVSISATNFTPGHPSLSILFDTNLTGTNDDDLQQPWTGGGNAASTNFHKILIIAENKVDNNHDGYIDRPDDEGGSQPAGYFDFKFTKPQQVFGFDLLDCDGSSEIGTGRDYVAFFKNGVELKRVGFGSFVDPTSKYYDPTVHYANNSANHLKPIDVSELGITNFDEAQVNMGWSTAIDNIVFAEDISSIQPEPGSLMLLAGPLLLTMRRRKVVSTTARR